MDTDALVAGRGGVAMAVRHEILMATDRGERFSVLTEISEFRYSRVVNGIGSFVLQMPADAIEERFLRPDYRVIFMRGVDERPQRVERWYFMRKFTWATDTSGNEVVIVEGPCLNDLLRRRIVAYAAGTAQADKTDYADDMMKEIIKQNMGGSSVMARRWSNDGLAVEGDLSHGPLLTKSFAWRNVLDVLGDLSEAARDAGTEVYFDLVPAIDATYDIVFATFTGQRGSDRRAVASMNPAIFSLEYGNLDTPQMIQDYGYEVTYVYGGGQGEEEARTIEEMSDSERLNRSAFGRIEDWQDARNEDSDAGVQDAARSRLASGRPRVRFIGVLRDMPSSRYGVEWDFGDRVTVAYRGQQYDGMIRSVVIGVDNQAVETIDARVEVDHAIV